MRPAFVKDCARRPEYGVDDGTRTHDDRDHNPGLYQLSYVHHCRGRISDHSLSHRGLRRRSLPDTPGRWRARQDSNLQPSA